MNLAMRDIRHNKLRFALTGMGLGLLLALVISMAGIYEGALEDALSLPRSASADLWVVQPRTKGPFAEPSRIPRDTRELVQRIPGVAEAGAVTFQTVQTVAHGVPLRLFIQGYEPGRLGGPAELASGHGITESHYQIVADTSSGLLLGEKVPIGPYQDLYTVVGFPRQVIGLLGPSGSGKTTLLNCIGCILEPSSGRITLDGEVVYDERWLRSDLRRLRLEKIGFIFQAHNLLPFLDCADNVAIVLDLALFDAATARARAIELLDYLEVGHRKHAMPATLSGGEAQRVAIARALANRPRIILADEPTAALDSQRAAVVMDLLRKVAVDQNAAIIAVTHDEKIFNRFEKIFQLRDGQLGVIEG